MSETIDVLISFDTTGSMFPCLTQVRRYVDETVRVLFDEIPGIRIAVISHGDYCDGPGFMTVQDFSENRDALCRFVKNAPQTGGGDSPEAYEAVLHRARELSWKSDRNRAMVLIADDEPHPVGYRYGSVVNSYDWKNEARLLKEMGVHVYAVQALGRYHANHFYEGLAKETGGVRLSLDQFQDVTPLIKGVCFKQAGNMPRFLTLLAEDERANPRIVRLIDVLEGRATTMDAPRPEAASRAGKPTRSRSGAEGPPLRPVHPSRFQVLKVDRDVCIKDFVEANGLTFKKGRGFYEFIKSVKVQHYKEVVIERKATGDFFEGDQARELLGLPRGKDATVKPDRLNDYRGFIQSTSNNRKLLAGTRFLYEVEDVR